MIHLLVKDIDHSGVRALLVEAPDDAGKSQSHGRLFSLDLPGIRSGLVTIRAIPA